MFFYVSSTLQAWDFHQDVGLIVAGGDGDSKSKKVELSTDYGQTKTSLPDIPYAINNWMTSACLVIVNETTVFMAGGHSESSAHNWVFKQCLLIIKLFNLFH